MSLEHILLGALEEPRSGYDLKQWFDDVFAFFWKLRVNAAIWRQALEIPVSAAYLLTLVLLLSEALLLFALVPAPVPAAP